MRIIIASVMLLALAGCGALPSIPGLGDSCSKNTDAHSCADPCHWNKNENKCKS